MRTAEAAFAAMLFCVLVTPAQAQLDGDWRGRAGVDNAKAAGIEVDPAVEDAMARAPVGSCPNDPTQANCPKATSVVAGPTAELPDGSVAFAPGPAADSSPQASAAQWPWQCQLRLSEQSPYKAAG